MAVVDLTMYKSTDGTPKHGILATGSDTIDIVQKFTIPDTSTVTSVLRLCEVPSNFVLTAGTIQYDGGNTAAMTIDAGLFETEEHGGGVIDVDCFVDGQDVSSAGSVSLLDAVAIGDLDKTMHELVVAKGVSRTDKSSTRQAYVLGITLGVEDADADNVCVLKATFVRKS
jgi:hypothetical protein